MPAPPPAARAMQVSTGASQVNGECSNSGGPRGPRARRPRHRRQSAASRPPAGRRPAPTLLLRARAGGARARARAHACCVQCAAGAGAYEEGPRFRVQSEEPAALTRTRSHTQHTQHAQPCTMPACSYQGLPPAGAAQPPSCAPAALLGHRTSRKRAGRADQPARAGACARAHALRGHTCTRAHAHTRESGAGRRPGRRGEGCALKCRGQHGSR